ncbi:hypothetical protein D9M69_560220 [compost metagenome]
MGQLPGPQVGVLLGHVAGDHMGIDPIGLGPCTQGLGVEVHVAGIEHEHLQARGACQGGEQLVIPPSGLHGQRSTGGQLTQPGGDGTGVVGHAAATVLAMDGHHQLGLGHIHTDKHFDLLHGNLLRETMTSVGVGIPASRVGLLKDRRYWVPLSSLSTLEGGVGAIFASRSGPIAGSAGPPPQHLNHTSRFHRTLTQDPPRRKRADFR